MANGSLDNFVFRPRNMAETASASHSSASSAPTTSTTSATSTTHLFRPSPSAPSAPLLPWRTRFSIALGTARGISYLHNDCHQCIVHCDIKPQNILLDDEFSPKVADFGLARLFHHRDDHLSMSAVRGTRGYLAPEWVGSDEINAKADVYSFGMVLLELVRGLNTEFDRWHLRDWAYESSISDSTQQIQQGEKSHDTESEQEEAQDQKRVLKIGLWCIQHFPSLRPSMARVVNMLEGTLPVEDPPYPAPVHTQPSLSEQETDPLQSFTVLSAR